MLRGHRERHPAGRAAASGVAATGRVVTSAGRAIPGTYRRNCCGPRRRAPSG